MDHVSPRKKDTLISLTCLLTFDLECWDEGDWLQPYLDSAQISEPTSDVAITEELLTLLRQANASATFFVTKRYVDRYPNIVKRIHEQGYEIGTHGPKHLRLEQQDPEQFRRDLRDHHERLHALGISHPIGYRAPHFSLHSATAWILPILVEEGYKYDSSQFAALSVEYGSARTPNTPHTISTSAGPLVEIPIPGLPIGSFRLPFAGGLYFRLLPGFVFRPMLWLLARTQQPHIYLHPHELSNKTPRLTRGPILRRYLKYFAVNSAFSKLHRLTRDFHFDSISATLF